MSIIFFIIAKGDSRTYIEQGQGLALDEMNVPNKSQSDIIINYD